MSHEYGVRYIDMANAVMLADMNRHSHSQGEGGSSDGGQGFEANTAKTPSCGAAPPRRAAIYATPTTRTTPLCPLLTPIHLQLHCKLKSNTMADRTNPYTALLNEIGNPMKCLKLQRMFRKVLVTEGESIRDLEEHIKRMAVAGTWNEKCSKLVDKAAAQTMKYAQADPWVKLLNATGDAITILELQAKFRKLWDPTCDRWLELDIRVREKLFDDILQEISQKQNVLPSEPDELVSFKNSLLRRVNEAGNKSWSLMKRSKAKRARTKREAETGAEAEAETGNTGETGEMVETGTGETGTGETGETGETGDNLGRCRV
ncbi:hypothetical protein DFP73DRAFT_621507 [Morchella snyderi]|nr:hypothetical protein DFP73DRAFT_621507 [Morchella snyderi]